MHKSKLLMAILGVSALASWLGATSAFAQTSPNILFILTEDAGAFDSVIGTPGVQTPGLESIANRGDLAACLESALGPATRPSLADSTCRQPLQRQPARFWGIATWTVLSTF